MKYTTLSIGDIHGRDVWKDFTHGSTYDFDSWQAAVMHGADADTEFWRPKDFLETHFMNVDKIIFVGDYVDSFDCSNVQMKKNLEDIIFFKKALPEKVVLLIGNHDVSYIMSDQRCSGFRPEMQHDFYKIYMDNIEEFQFAYEHQNTLWTHAGVTKGWIRELNAFLKDDEQRFYSFTKDYVDLPLVDKLNESWKLRLAPLFNVDRYSGGWNAWAGPLWVRPKILNAECMKSIQQVVGHTPMDQVTQVGTITYIDCLEYGEEKPYIKIFEQ